MNKLVIKPLLGIGMGITKSVGVYTLNSDKINFIFLDIFSLILCFV